MIEDRLADQRGIFTGIAAFTGEGPTLLYSEDGTLTLGQNTMQASRRYGWQIDGSKVRVTHEFGEPFHDFIIINDMATAAHLCGDDTYYGEYKFYFPDRWQVVWTVSGPRKDYTSTTLYSR